MGVEVGRDPQGDETLKEEKSGEDSLDKRGLQVQKRPERVWCAWGMATLAGLLVAILVMGTMRGDRMKKWCPCYQVQACTAHCMTGQ